MNKILDFILICLCLLGFLGGTGYAVYNKAYVIAIGVIGLGYAAWPKVRDTFKELTK